MFPGKPLRLQNPSVASSANNANHSDNNNGKKRRHANNGDVHNAFGMSASACPLESSCESSFKRLKVGDGRDSAGGNLWGFGGPTSTPFQTGVALNAIPPRHVEGTPHNFHNYSHHLHSQQHHQAQQQRQQWQLQMQQRGIAPVSPLHPSSATSPNANSLKSEEWLAQQDHSGKSTPTHSNLTQSPADVSSNTSTNYKPMNSLLKQLHISRHQHGSRPHEHPQGHYAQYGHHGQQTSPASQNNPQHHKQPPHAHSQYPRTLQQGGGSVTRQVSAQDGDHRRTPPPSAGNRNSAEQHQHQQRQQWRPHKVKLRVNSKLG